MRSIITYIIIVGSIFLAQDSRSIIFNTGTPETEEGYIVSGETSIADRFSVLNDYALEAFKVTMAMESELASLLVSIHEDNDNTPGNIMGTWNLTLTATTAREYTVYTLGECITFSAGENYWISIKAADSLSAARWIYSPNDSYSYSISNDNQTTWNSSEGFAGSTKIYAEIFYETDPIYGDINLDQQLNVLDVVTMVSYVVGTSDLNDEQMVLGDANNDGSIDVLDIVQTVSAIVSSEPMPSFTLLDFNPNSDYNGQYIGPETFTNEVSCYYFGKQG
tara:strand:- start:458 stop:1291 length:834 start_codon:yes stop_codon:yes gene_type:complete